MFEKFDVLWSMFDISFGRLNEGKRSEIPKALVPKNLKLNNTN